jgi:hypothetical protein
MKAHDRRKIEEANTAHAQMSRAQAVDIIERGNRGRTVDYLDWSVAATVIARDEQRRAEASKGPAGFLDAEAGVLVSGPELRGSTRGNVGALEAGGWPEAGAELVQRLDGRLTDAAGRGDR